MPFITMIVSSLILSPTIDAKKVETDFATFKQTLQTKLGAGTLTYADYTKSVKDQAIKMLDGVDLGSQPKSSMKVWAGLEEAAGNNPQAITCWTGYLKSDLSKEDRFNSSLSLSTDYLTANQPQMALKAIRNLSPSDASQAGIFTDTVTNIADSIGSTSPKDGLRILNNEEKLIDYTKVDTNPAGVFRESIAEEKVNLLVAQHDIKDAKKVANDVVALIPATSKYAHSSASMLAGRLNLYGNPAPEFSVLAKYGDYTSLAALKGKVVVLDFFAHWCPPCRASMPDMRAMTDADDSKGLQVIGVTSYYGYYFEHKKLDEKTEYGYMKDFMAKFQIDHPVIYEKREDIGHYFTPGIPEFVLIGKDGNVIDAMVGYDKAGFAKFRAEVEAAIAK